MGITVEELYKKIKSSDSLTREAVRTLRTKEDYEKFLKENDCDATVTEAIIYFNKHSALGKGYVVDFDDEGLNYFK